MRRVDSSKKTLMLGGIGGRRRRGQQRMRWLDGITDSLDWVWVNSRSWWWIGRPGMLRFMGSQRVGHDWATELDWWGQLIRVCISKKKKKRNCKPESSVKIISKNRHLLHSHNEDAPMSVFNTKLWISSCLFPSNGLASQIHPWDLAESQALTLKKLRDY